MSLPQQLTRSDILPVLHRVLPFSFGREDTNVRALIRLGWYHLNRALLFDPRVLQRASSSASTNVSGSQSFESIEDMGLNVSNGVAGTIVLDYAQQLERNTALQQARDQRRQQAAEANGTLDAIKGRITGGRLFSHGTVALDSEVLALVERSAQGKADKLYATLKKKAVAFDALCDDYEMLLHTGKDESAYNCKDLKAYIGVRRLKEDKAIPNKKEALIAMKSRLANREQLDLKEHLSSHTKCDEDQIDDFLEQYYAELEAEIGEDGDDEEEVESDEIGQRAEV